MITAASLLSGLVALGLLYWLCQAFAIVLFEEPTLVEQKRRSWGAK